MGSAKDDKFDPARKVENIMLPGRRWQYAHKGNARNTESPIAWSVVATRLRRVTVREDAMGWRKKARVVPRRPGNTGGATGLWFRMGAKISKAREVGVTLRKLWKCAEAVEGSTG